MHAPDKEEGVIIRTWFELEFPEIAPPSTTKALDGPTQVSGDTKRFSRREQESRETRTADDRIRRNRPWRAIRVSHPPFFFHPRSLECDRASSLSAGLRCEMCYLSVAREQGSDVSALLPRDLGLSVPAESSTLHCTVAALLTH